MRILMVGLLLLAATGSSLGSDKSKEDALKSAGLLLGLIQSCHVAGPGQPDAKSGEAEAAEILVAGGYEASVAASMSSEMVQRIASLTESQFDKDTCVRFLASVRAAEPAAMEQLRSEQ